jgi:hypothetical protein
MIFWFDSTFDIFQIVEEFHVYGLSLCFDFISDSSQLIQNP